MRFELTKKIETSPIPNPRQPAQSIKLRAAMSEFLSSCSVTITIPTRPHAHQPNPTQPNPPHCTNMSSTSSLTSTTSTAVNSPTNSFSSFTGLDQLTDSERALFERRLAGASRPAKKGARKPTAMEVFSSDTLDNTVVKHPVRVYRHSTKTTRRPSAMEIFSNTDIDSKVSADFDIVPKHEAVQQVCAFKLVSLKQAMHSATIRFRGVFH